MPRWLDTVVGGSGGGGGHSAWEYGNHGLIQLLGWD